MGAESTTTIAPPTETGKAPEKQPLISPPVAKEQNPDAPLIAAAIQQDVKDKKSPTTLLQKIGGGIKGFLHGGRQPDAGSENVSQTSEGQQINKIMGMTDQEYTDYK